MSRFLLTRRALKDLDGIADHTRERWGLKQMERYLAALERRFEWLAQHPLLGRDRSDVAPRYRCHREGMHLIFHIVDDDEVRIIGVPHVAMDIDSYFE